MTTSDLSQLDAEQLRELLVHSQREVATMKLLVEKTTHEMAVLKRSNSPPNALWDPHRSTVAEQALKFFAALYDIEREAQGLVPDDRR